MKGENEITEKLLKQLNKDGKIHLVPARIKDDYIIRFTVTSFYTTEEDIQRDWMIIKNTADLVIDIIESKKKNIEKKKRFQSSLMLSNVPQTPKIVNASFLAFFMDSDLASERVKELNSRDYLNSPLPLTARRSAKQKGCLNNGLSFDQLVTLFDGSSLKPAPGQTLNEIDKNSGETETDKLFEIFERTLSGSATPNRKNQSQTKYSKQASLDSKIQHIYEEADDLDNLQASATNGKLINEEESDIKNSI